MGGEVFCLRFALTAFRLVQCARNVNKTAHHKGDFMPAFRRSLDPLFFPASVAVVGASATPGSVGSILTRNLLENQFGGVVYPVNPKRHAVHGVLCYPT